MNPGKVERLFEENFGGNLVENAILSRFMKNRHFFAKKRVKEFNLTAMLI